VNDVRKISSRTKRRPQQNVVYKMHKMFTAMIDLIRTDSLIPKTIHYAKKMITVVIETFARCQLYRLLWP